MSESLLIKLPVLEELLAQKPIDLTALLVRRSDEETAKAAQNLTWLSQFDSAVMRKYIGEWFQWYLDGQSADTPPQAFDQTLAEYLPIAGQNMPWFGNAVSTVCNADPQAQSPILTLYLSAKIETLSTLRTFQEHFLQEVILKDVNPDVRTWIGMKAERTAKKNALPLLFDSIANAYEHAFSFVIRMFGEFGTAHGRMPSYEEFERLKPQLLKLLGKEARLSRAENIILEEHFYKDQTFFSFQGSGNTLQLGILYPTEEQKVAIAAEVAARGGYENVMRFVKGQIPGHYGCPAAFTSYQGSNPIKFVFDKTTEAFQTGVWASDNPALQPLIPFESYYRERLADSLNL